MDRQISSEQNTPLKSYKKQPPEDKGSLVYIIIFIWGFGVLLPWNVIVNCFDYFENQMPDYKPSFYFGFGNNGFLCFTMLFMIAYGHKFTERLKIQVCFFLGSVILMLLPILSSDALDTPKVRFLTVFGILFLFGIINGTLQGSVFGAASILPPKYVNIMMVGQGISGVLATILKGILSAALPGEENYQKSAIIFFSLGSIMLLIASASYSIVKKTDFYQFYENSGNQKQLEINDSDLSLGEQKVLIQNTETTVTELNQESGMQRFIRSTKQNLKSAWQILFAMFFVFFVTFLIFPGLMFSQSLDLLKGKTDEKTWTIFILNMLFQVFDTLGRISAGFKIFQIRPTIVYFLSFIRIIFILVIIGCLRDWSKFFDNDAIKIINMSLFALTNGFVSTQCAIKAPSMVSDDQKGSIGQSIGFSLSLGIMMGSILCIPMAKISP